MNNSLSHNVLRNSLLILAAIPAALLVSSCNDIKLEMEPVTTLSVSLQDTDTKTYLGPSVEGHRAVYWSNGDCLSLNGTASNPLSGIAEGTTGVTFTFPGVLSAPYNLLYPASFFKDASTITLPANQAFAEGTIAANTAPLVAYAESAGAQIALHQICAFLQLRVKKDPSVALGTIEKLTFTGNAGEQVSGDFTVNYSAHSISSASAAEADKSVSLVLSQSLSESSALDLFLVVPAGSYESGFTVVLTDSDNRTMTKVKSSAITLAAGQLSKFPEFTFVPSSIATEFGIADVEEDVITPDGYNITGRVVDSSSNPLEGVVVSDGTQCVRTLCDGSFYMTSTIADVKFVHVSTPSGYMPQVSAGLPRFYKAKADITPSDGIYDFGDFVLTPVANPDRFTLIITADPQPRKFNWTLDKIAYKSLDVCQDLYQELADVSGSISGRQVYGICLGDVVHEDMSLYTNYCSGLSTLSYPTYNVIGNHDNDPEAADDDSAAETFESAFGPRNYSFNIGGIHFVVLDNLIMKDNGEGSLTGFDQGLTDRIWAWLQADMSYIPTSTKVMVCAHSPMFKLISGSERTNSAYHAGTRSDKDGGAFGYGDLFDRYAEVHAWAGHTHVGFNYIYPSNHRHRSIQVHTLARSTGELWTNEYLSAGTPRGFTVVEVDNGDISWRFHPLTRQSGSFQGVTTGYCSAGAPAYTWRDWDYNGSGIAVMRNGGSSLDENYQMHVYPRGAYGDDYVYANIFLWDDKWGTPVWTPDGGSPVAMTRINTADNHSVITDTENIYDKADTEFRTWYKTYANKSGGSLADLDGYTTVDIDRLTTIFRAPASASPNSGTVSVTDRFGNVYSRSVSW